MNPTPKVILQALSNVKEIFCVWITVDWHKLTLVVNVHTIFSDVIVMAMVDVVVGTCTAEGRTM